MSNPTDIWIPENIVLPKNCKNITDCEDDYLTFVWPVLENEEKRVDILVETGYQNELTITTRYKKDPKDVVDNVFRYRNLQGTLDQAQIAYEVTRENM